VLSAEPGTGERALWRYLVLPRPGDLVKAWILPAGFLVGALAAGIGGPRELLRAALVWIALELLIYQARYQWNDIRGFEADQRHPDRAGRGRLPGPLSRGQAHIRASALLAGGRLGLVALLALAPTGLGLGWPLVALTVAAFAIAALYEALRARVTGRSGEVPPPLRPGLVALWVVVGGGYALRGVCGLALAVDLSADPWLALAATIAMWSFGIAFVTSRWALEALAFARLGERGGIVWSAEAGQAREHSLALVRWLPAQVAGGPGALDRWPALRAGAAPLAPWNLAGMLAAAAAAASGLLLAGDVAPAAPVVGALLGGLLAAAAILRPGRRWPLWLLAGAALAVAAALAGSSRPLLAALPWLLIVGAELLFTAQSPATLAHPLRSALPNLRTRASAPRRRAGGPARPAARG
jgi:hypothetical protein